MVVEAVEETSENDGNTEAVDAEPLAEDDEEGKPAEKPRTSYRNQKNARFRASCSDCGRAYAHEESYLSHVMKVHGKELPGLKKYACGVCSHVDYTHYAHTHHLKLHTGETDECDICGYKSRYQSNVRQHRKKVHKLDA